MSITDIGMCIVAYIVLGWMIVEYVEAKWNIQWINVHAQIASTVVMIVLWPLILLAIISDAVEDVLKRKKRNKF